MLTGNGSPKRWSVPIPPPLGTPPKSMMAWLGAPGPTGVLRGRWARRWRVAGGGLSTEAVDFFGPTPQPLGAGAGRFGQEESGEVIITCLSFSRDV